MYNIYDATYNNLIETVANPVFLKQQERVDRPIAPAGLTLDEADGVVLSDGDTMVGIAGRNMENYTPLVTIKEVSSDPYVFARLEAMQSQINAVQGSVDTVHAYQTEETVLRSELDAAYTQGVNAI